LFGHSFIIQDYYLPGPQETGTDPVFIYIYSGYTLQIGGQRWDLFKISFVS